MPGRADGPPGSPSRTALHAIFGRWNRRGIDRRSRQGSGVSAESASKIFEFFHAAAGSVAAQGGLLPVASNRFMGPVTFMIQPFGRRMNIANQRGRRRLAARPEILTSPIAAISGGGRPFSAAIMDAAVLRVGGAGGYAAGVTDFSMATMANWDQQSAFAVLDPSRQLLVASCCDVARTGSSRLGRVGGHRDPVPRILVSGLREYSPRARQCPRDQLANGKPR